MPTSTLTSKGQVTVPKEIRERLGLRQGSRLVFVIDEDGRLIVRVKPRSGIDDVVGFLRHLKKDRAVSVRQMNQAVRRRAAEKAKRARA